MKKILGLIIILVVILTNIIFTALNIMSALHCGLLIAIGISLIITLVVIGLIILVNLAISWLLDWEMLRMYKDLIEANHMLIALNTEDIGFELVYHRDESCLVIRFLVFVIAIG